MALCFVICPMDQLRTLSSTRYNIRNRSRQSILILTRVLASVFRMSASPRTTIPSWFSPTSQLALPRQSVGCSPVCFRPIQTSRGGESSPSTTSGIIYFSVITGNGGGMYKWIGTRVLLKIRIQKGGTEGRIAWIGPADDIETEMDAEGNLWHAQWGIRILLKGIVVSDEIVDKIRCLRGTTWRRIGEAFCCPLRNQNAMKKGIHRQRKKVKRMNSDKNANFMFISQIVRYLKKIEKQ